jgi:hypothetical protein
MASRDRGGLVRGMEDGEVRIRTIKPEFFKHDKLAELPAMARLLFISLWCLADRRGRLEDRPKRIKVECLPYDDCDVDALLQVLHCAGFICRYEAESVRVIEIEAFEKHQRITGKEAETESHLPGKQRGSNGEATGATPDAQEGKGKERKGVDEAETEAEGKRKRSSSVRPTEGEWLSHCQQAYSDWHPTCISEQWAYYESVGWKTKAGPIKDWKRAAVTAHGNARSWGKLQPITQRGGWQQQPQSLPALECNPGEMTPELREAAGRL